MTSWIKSPALWTAATERAAKEKPRWTLAFWRRVQEIYTSIGGRFEEDEEVPEPTTE